MDTNLSLTLTQEEQAGYLLGTVIANLSSWQTEREDHQLTVAIESLSQLIEHEYGLETAVNVLFDVFTPRLKRKDRKG